MDFCGVLAFPLQPLLPTSYPVSGSSFTHILERGNLVASTCFWLQMLSLWGASVLDALILGHVDLQGQPLTALHQDKPVLLSRRSLGPRLGLGSTQSAGEVVLEKLRELK